MALLFALHDFPGWSNNFKTLKAYTSLLSNNRNSGLSLVVSVSVFSQNYWSKNRESPDYNRKRLTHYSYRHSLT